MKNLQREAQSIVDSFFGGSSAKRASLHWLKEANERLDRDLPGLDPVALTKLAMVRETLDGLMTELRQDLFTEGGEEWKSLPYFGREPAKVSGFHDIELYTT